MWAFPNVSLTVYVLVLLNSSFLVDFVVYSIRYFQSSEAFSFQSIITLFGSPTVYILNPSQSFYKNSI